MNSTITDAIVEVLGYKVTARLVAEYYGISTAWLSKLIEKGTYDRELFEKSCHHADEKMNKCKRCYFHGKNSTCCYPLFYDDILTQDYTNCPRFQEGEPDFDDFVGCGNCKHFNAELLFSGTCKYHNILVKSYRPSCEDFYKGVEK